MPTRLRDKSAWDRAYERLLAQATQRAQARVRELKRQAAQPRVVVVKEHTRKWPSRRKLRIRPEDLL